MTSPTQSITPIVEESAFTLVEEDDVAFSLSLCREIYRIYGTYLSGELTASDSVRHGLLLTLDMFAVMQTTVTDGMPAMRIQVAAAQTSEMIATLFGQVQPVKRLPTGWPGREQSCRRHGRRALPNAGGAEGGILMPSGGHGQQKELGVRTGTVPTHEVDTSQAIRDPGASAKTVPFLQRIRQRCVSGWDRQSLVVKVLGVVVACCLTAGLIDLPFAVVALFPNLWIPLVLGYACVAVLCARACRTKASRLRPIQLG